MVVGFGWFVEFGWVDEVIYLMSVHVVRVKQLVFFKAILRRGLYTHCGLRDAGLGEVYY